MADRGLFKENLKYHRVVVICIVITSIWLQYNFYSPASSYSNGQIKVSGEKLNGKDHGIWTWFHPNGKKQMEGKFIEGKRAGIWTVWNINGQKISESNYQNDKLNGTFTTWGANGEIQKIGLYQNDKLIRTEH
ncbi:MAG: hypothetical protein JNL24_14585 [Bacteroidia bacterium]|nr:hypothetical protein [Bacteroidia bacterium]